MIERMRGSWSSAQQRVIGENGFMISAASLFPNLSFVHNWPKVANGSDSDTVLPFISIRQWQPISADETEVLSWFAVDAAAPAEFKKLSYKAYLMCFGSTGMFEQDDVENWVSITSTAAGSMARRLLLNNRMACCTTTNRSTPPAGALGRPRYRVRRLRRVQPARDARAVADCLAQPVAEAARTELGAP